MKIDRVLVLGGGSAGLLAALTLKVRLPALEVRVVRSQELGVIGVGEGSTVGLPGFLHGCLGIDPADFFARVRPVWKLGLRFAQWGPRAHFNYTFAPAIFVRWGGLSKLAGFYCDDEMSCANQASALMEHDRVFTRAKDGAPEMFREFGYHLENKEFVDYLETHAIAVGIELIDDKVVEVLQDDRGITTINLASGRAVSADLYLDCSGFASLLLGRALQEPFQSFRATLFCDRAVVGGWNRTTEPVKPYTGVAAMNAGWAWRIEHERRINCGYVYSSAFISDQEAEVEFREAHPHVDSTRIVPFISGRYQRAWVRNVVAIGNACGFVEPLEATSLGAICSEAAALTEVLADGDLAPTPSAMAFFNRRVAESWDNIRRFLAVHYKFNTRQQTPFWDACRRDTDLGGAEEIVSFYEENGPTDLARIALLSPFDQFTLDGWLTLLVGQRVPYQRRHRPTSSEEQMWARIRASVRARAQEGLTVPEALAVIRSPRWKWNPQFFRAG